MIAFEMIGGVERMADWADENPGEFYTKLFPKILTREVEVQGTVTVEDAIARLDRKRRGEGHPSDRADIQDADFEFVEDDDSTFGMSVAEMADAGGFAGEDEDDS